MSILALGSMRALASDRPFERDDGSGYGILMDLEEVASRSGDPGWSASLLAVLE